MESLAASFSARHRPPPEPREKRSCTVPPPPLIPAIHQHSRAKYLSPRCEQFCACDALIRGGHMAEPWNVDGFCLYGCYSKPQAVVWGSASPAVSEDLARVSVVV